MADAIREISDQIGALCESACTVPPCEPVINVKKIFDANSPCSAVVVVQDRQIRGLVMKARLTHTLSRRHGFSFLRGKPVSRVMDKTPMILPHDLGLADAAEKAMKREDIRLYDPVIVTVEGVLSGIVPVRKILNALVKELKDHKENLEQVVDERSRELRTEINERIQVEKKLKEEMVRAEEGAGAKIEFVTNMSHEIRTPINGIMGMAELALEQELSADLKETFTIIDNEATHLLGIINQILDFSKIEAGKFAMEEISFDLRHTFEQACASLAMGANDKGLEFLSFLSPDIPAGLVGDPGRLRQVLVNLAGNAVKFTHTGEVVVKGELAKNHDDAVELRFLVKDTGIGIPWEKQKTIFDSFSQADGSTTRKYGGTGLGTTISKQLVELMGGSIGLESEAGKGSTFWFTVTFKKQAGQAKGVSKTDEALKGLKVLIMDDNPAYREMLDQYLRSFGCVTCLPETTGDAVSALKENAGQGSPVNVVIVNHNLYGMNGFKLVRHIRRTDTAENVPIILLTATGKQGDAEICRNIGINAYLVKPVKTWDLKAAVLSVLGRAERHGVRAGGLVTRHTIAEERTRDIRVLLAEDYPTNQRIIMQHLTGAGYQATLAENGRIAVAYARQRRFDLILMDIQMPEMDGYEATRQIRRDEEKLARLGETRRCPAARIPIIAMTAHAVKGYREKCLAAGMDDYMTKPVRRSGILEMIQKWAPRKGEKTAACAASADSAGPAGPSGEPGLRGPGNNGEAAALSAGSTDGRDVFDAEKALAEFEGDGAFLREVLDEFLENLETVLPEMESALRKGDARTLSRQAHAIKGGAANLTAARLSETAYTLERMGKSGCLDAAGDVLAQMIAEVGRLRTSTGGPGLHLTRTC